jgi:hypothetical protein
MKGVCYIVVFILLHDVYFLSVIMDKEFTGTK